MGTPTGHHTGLHVGSQPWHPPRGVFLVPRQAGPQPWVSQSPQSHPAVGNWSITLMASTTHYETPKNPPHPPWDPSHQHRGSGGTGRCCLSRARPSFTRTSFARLSFARPSRAGAVGSRKPSVAAAAQPKHLLGSGQTSSGGRSQLHLTALASGPGRPRREPGAREPPWEPPPAPPGAGTAPPVSPPTAVPAPTRCHRDQAPVVLGQRLGTDRDVPGLCQHVAHVTHTWHPRWHSVAAGAGPDGGRVSFKTALIIRPLPAPVPTSCHSRGPSPWLGGTDVIFIPSLSLLCRCPHPSIAPGPSAPSPLPALAVPGRVPPPRPDPGVIWGHGDSQGSGRVMLLWGDSRGHGGM